MIHFKIWKIEFLWRWQLDYSIPDEKFLRPVMRAVWYGNEWRPKCWTIWSPK